MDPGSIVGIVAFPLGAIAFLADTVGSLARKGEAIKQCEERLREYCRQLTKCKSDLDHWVELWYPQSNFAERQQFCEDTYRYMWGEDTYEKVQQHLETIKALSMQIEKHVMEGTENNVPRIEAAVKWTEKLKSSLKKRVRVFDDVDATKDDWEGWRAFHKARTHNPEPRTRSSLSRIAYALYESEYLDDKLSRLQRATLGLEELSVFELKKVKRRMLDRDFHERDIGKALKLNAYYCSLKKFSKKIHQAQQTLDTAGRWELVLRFPDSRGDVENWESLSTLDIDFAVQHMSPESQKARQRVRVQHKRNTRPENAAKHLLDHIEKPNGGDSSMSESGNLSRTQLSIPFQKIFDTGHLQNERAKIASRKERASLTWKYVNWVILLWDTPWMRDPCSCALRFERNGNAEHKHVLLLESTEECRNQYLAGNHKLVLLGLVLAELTTVYPIRIKVGSPLTKNGQPNAMRPMESMAAFVAGGLPRFDLEHCEWDHSTQEWMGWTPISIESLLNDVQRTSGSHGYRSAVEYCLDGVLSRRSGAFSPNFVEEFVENILVPIRKYYDVVNEHTNTFTLAAYIQDLWFGKPWPTDVMFEHQHSNDDIWNSPTASTATFVISG